AVPVLITTMKGDQGDTGPSVSAITALGLIGPAAKEAVPALIAEIAQLKGPGGGFGGKGGGGFGGNRLPSIDHRYSVVIVTLGQIGPAAKAAVPELIPYLNTSARLETAVALGNIGPDAKEAVAPLTALLESIPEEAPPDLTELRAAVKGALKKIGK
ncbi:MAG TPA: hypothetical protein VE988_03405, partial [Gemmataceae bacterium]|nr:hypothetical protein [Gemmataceae bacterium]